MKILKKTFKKSFQLLNKIINKLETNTATIETPQKTEILQKKIKTEKHQKTTKTENPQNREKTTKTEKTPKTKNPSKPLSPSDLFKKVELRIGKIEKIQEIENSENLYSQQINIGYETRSVISGLKKKFKKENLENQKVLLICNLKKRKILKHESEGMILCAVNDREIALLAPKGEIGDRLGLGDGFEDFGKIKNLKTREFEGFMELLEVRGGFCYYDGGFLDFVEKCCVGEGKIK